MNLKQVLNEAGIAHLIEDHMPIKKAINKVHLFATFASYEYNGTGMPPAELSKTLQDEGIDIDPMMFIFAVADDGLLNYERAREYIEESDCGNVAIAAVCMMVQHAATRTWTIEQVKRGIGDCITASDILSRMGYISDSEREKIYKMDKWG